jgi:MFS family permease
VVAAFVMFGLFWGSWAVMLFNIQRAFRLSDADIGGLLALAVAVAAVSSAVMAHLADRVGARRLLWIALFAWAVLLCLMSLARQRWLFAGALVLVEIAGGSIDTAMNAEASHRLIGNPAALVRFHALFNVGALAGAAAAGIVIGAGVSFRWTWPAIAAVALAVGMWTLLTDSGLPMIGAAEHPPSTASTHPVRRLRREGLIMLLFVFALAEVTEGGVDTWGVLFLRNTLASGVLLGAGAYVVGQAMAATTRGAGGTLLGRLSARRALVVGGCVAGGVLLESLTHQPVLAAIGLMLGTGGAALFWPLVMNTVSRQASQVVSAVGTFTAAGYIGWVAGAPLVGWVSQTYGAARGLQILAVAAGGVALASLLRAERSPAPKPTR